jgi:NADH:ubiquinone oxidoreductase subunit E
MTNNNNVLQSLDRKRKAVITLLLDESFEVEYYENNKLIHSFEAVNVSYDKVQEQANQFVNYESSPVLLEG